MTENMIQIITAFIGSLGFAVFFGIKGKQILLAGLGGALTWIVYLVIADYLGGIFVPNMLAAVFAALAICLSLSVSAMAASGLLKGFFQDVKRPDGAVIGTTYEQATDEIALKVNVDGNTLMAVAAFTDKAPFIAAEMGIGNYQIVDGNGKVVKDGSYTEHTKIIDGQAEIRIDISDIDNGSYKLIVTSFVAYNKADPPMAVNGDWACNFTK